MRSARARLKQLPPTTNNLMWLSCMKTRSDSLALPFPLLATERTLNNWMKRAKPLKL